jgi:hypothetical protein
MVGVEEGEEFAGVSERLAAATADVLDYAAQLVLAGFCAAFGSGWDLDRERLHRLCRQVDWRWLYGG